MQFHFDEDCDGCWKVKEGEVGRAVQWMCESECQEEGRDRDNGLRFSSHFNGWTLNQDRECVCDNTGSGRGQQLRSRQWRSKEGNGEEIEDKVAKK